MTEGPRGGPRQGRTAGGRLREGLRPGRTEGLLEGLLPETTRGLPGGHLPPLASQRGTGGTTALPIAAGTCGLRFVLENQPFWYLTHSYWHGCPKPSSDPSHRAVSVKYD